MRPEAVQNLADIISAGKEILALPVPMDLLTVPPDETHWLVDGCLK